MKFFPALTISAGIFACLLSRPTLAFAQDSSSSAAIGGTSAEESGTCPSYTILGRPDEFMEGTQPGVKLAIRRWVPDQDPKAVVLFAHGGAGFHSGYSDIMGTFQKENGIAVIAYDSMGSGHSTGVDGLRTYYPSMPALTEEYTTMLRRVRAEYPETKVFAMGESFGGMILANQILEEQDKGDDGSLADGYVFTGPVIKVLPEMLPPKFVIKILIFLSRFFPMAQMPGSDFFSTFDLAFGDQGWAKAGRADPFVIEASGNPPRLGMAASLLSSMDEMYSRLNEVQVPFKIFTGEFEKRVDTDAIQHFYNVAPSKDKALEIVDGAYHQLFQDMPDVTAKVNAGVRDWILERA